MDAADSRPGESRLFHLLIPLWKCLKVARFKYQNQNSVNMNQKKKKKKKKKIKICYNDDETPS